MPNNLELPERPETKAVKVLKMLKKIKMPAIPESIRTRLPTTMPQLPEKLRNRIPSIPTGHVSKIEALREKFRDRLGRRDSWQRQTDYPFLLFHGTRLTQLVASIIVMSIMSYFLTQLKADGVSSPWTFILLLTVSVFTILTLAGTIVLHCLFGLNPKVNMMLNGSLLFLWFLGFTLLTWWSSSTLGHTCNLTRWQDDIGVEICRSYKALFAFTLFGFVATGAAALLDFHVFRQLKKADRRADAPEELARLDMKHPTTSTLHLPDPSTFTEAATTSGSAADLKTASGPTSEQTSGVVAQQASPYNVFKPDVVISAPPTPKSAKSTKSAKSRKSSSSSTRKPRKPSSEGYSLVGNEAEGGYEDVEYDGPATTAVSIIDGRKFDGKK